MFNLEDLTEIDRVHIHLDSIRQLVFAYEVVVWMALQCVHPIMGLEFWLSEISFLNLSIQNASQDEVDDEYEEEPEVADEFDSDFNEDVSYVSVSNHSLFCST